MNFIPSWLLTPVARVASLVLAVAALAAAIYTKGHHDDHVAFKEKIERESTATIQRADTARRAATDQFNAGGLRNDGFRRD